MIYTWKTQISAKGALREGKLSESIKRWKLAMEILFLDNVEWSSKNLWKMMSADVKANIKTQIFFLKRHYDFI